MNQLKSIPDFTKDPRRLKKAKAALELCYELDLSKNGCKQISATNLRKVLGNQSNSNSEFSAFLHTLVRQVGVYSKINGTTYGYQTVPHRVSRLEALIGQEGGLRMHAEMQGKSFAVCPSRDEYKLADDNRYYCWFTNVRKEIRQKLFVETHGVLYDYDIEAAKATVTLQAWREWMQINHPGALRSSNACKLATWSKLVYNRKAFRKQLAEEVGISVQHAKEICQSVLNSGFATPHFDNPICQLIGTNATRVLLDNDLYKGLRADFQTMWQYFEEIADEGQTSGQFMSAMYNKQEKQIMDAVAESLSVDAWYVHDGFMTHEEVDMEILAEQVKQKTGLNVKFEIQIFGDMNGTDEQVKEEDNKILVVEAGGDPGTLECCTQVQKITLEQLTKNICKQEGFIKAKLNERRWSQSFLSTVR